MNLYDILKSKPHNEHYLNRYIKFILYCKEKGTSESYTESHHICPKSKTMFPEYEDMNVHSWNLVELSAKQHILAHILLWKAYGGDQIVPVHYMLSVQNSYTNYNSRKVPSVVTIRYATKAKKEFGEWRLGKATYKDSNGNKFFLDVNDPKINELQLVGNVSGRVHSEESKQKMSDTKYPNKTVMMYFLNATTWVGLFSVEFSEYLEQGWSTTKTSDDYIYCKNSGNKELSDYWSGRMRYMDVDGVYYGSYLKDDPIIADKKLVPLRTKSQIDQNASRTELATLTKTGTNIYNNGKEEKFLKEAPDSSWVIGRLERSETWESKRIESVRDKVVGSKTYTNGKVNMFIKEGDVIPDGFYVGMKFRDGVTYYYTNKDKSDVLTFVGQHTPPENYNKLKERDAVVFINKLTEMKIWVKSKEDVKDLLDKCSVGGRINPNKVWLLERNKSDMCRILGVSEMMKFSEIAKCFS